VFTCVRHPGHPAPIKNPGRRRQVLVSQVKCEVRLSAQLLDGPTGERKGPCRILAPPKGASRNRANKRTHTLNPGNYRLTSTWRFVRPPRTGVNAASLVRGLGVEEVEVIEATIGVATRERDAGGVRLHASKLAAPFQDGVAPGENGRMNPHAADP